ncbi:hypothetical protein PSAB_20730 [Paenibacillus sabinae T27]|uniref:Uncharacterized protein n=1 Tax=Paenibacillus sabinae T27 TaxID=1268072 RepID=X4ZPC7_9BACL|nr:hypothetical protein PSAB_20730 [Paenibacillus sabinae T27]
MIIAEGPPSITAVVQSSFLVRPLPRSFEGLPGIFGSATGSPPVWPEYTPPRISPRKQAGRGGSAQQEPYS